MTKPGDDLMPAAEFARICKRYKTDHLVIRTELLKMGCPADTDGAVYMMAGRFAEFADLAQDRAPSKMDHEALRRRITEVLTNPMAAVKIAELVGAKSADVEHCLNVEKNDWFRQTHGGLWKRSKRAASFFGIWGRKAKTKRAGPRTKAPRAKKKQPPTKKEAARANKSNAAEGRRAVARGDRPPMKKAMATVMGTKTVAAAEVVEGLTKRGWLPLANDPQQYVSYMLSSNKDVFERMKRGYYRVRVRDGSEKPVPKADAESLRVAILSQLTLKFMRGTYLLERLHKIPALSALKMSELTTAVTKLVEAGQVDAQNRNNHVEWRSHDSSTDKTNGFGITNVASNPFDLQ